MTTVLKFRSFKPTITNTKSGDGWTDLHGVPTTVGIDGSLKLDTALRVSESIRNEYKLHAIDSSISCLFETIKVGVGSKHIYREGGFMKKHYDSRLPPTTTSKFNNETKKYDTIEVEHIMTMLIIKNTGYRGGELYINEEQYVSAAGSYNRWGDDDNYVTVLFSLNASHEVKPVLGGVREVFAFPVYGTYSPLSSLKRLLSTSKCDSIKDIVLEKLNEELAIHDTTREDDDQKVNPKSSLQVTASSIPLRKDQGTSADDRRAMLQGYIAALDDRTASEMIIRYRKMQGDYVYTDSYRYDDDVPVAPEMKTKVTYVLDGVKHTAFVYDKMSLPTGATNVKLYIVNMSYLILEELINHIKKVEVSVLRSGVTYRGPSTTPDTILPKNPFVVYLQGRYFKDATIDNLVPEDVAAMNAVLAAGRKVEFVPIGKSSRYDSHIPSIMYEDGKFVEKTPSSDRVSSMYVEFDDQGSYDPMYELVFGMLIVE